MKKTARLLLFILTVSTLLLSACGGAATPNTGGGKVEAIPVAFTGMVESIAGDQWVINGQTVTVDPAVVRDGPFNAGDRVKVEGVVNPDGSFAVSRVETPSTEDLSTLPQFGDDNSNNANSNDADDDNGNIANSNDANANDDNGNTANSNDANANDGNGNDANSNDDNSNAANSNDANVNDDNGNDANTNDDNSNAANSNDDNSNDANSNDDNSNTAGNDNGGNSNGG